MRTGIKQRAIKAYFSDILQKAADIDEANRPSHASQEYIWQETIGNIAQYMGVHPMK